MCLCESPYTISNITWFSLLIYIEIKGFEFHVKQSTSCIIYMHMLLFYVLDLIDNDQQSLTGFVCLSGSIVFCVAGWVAFSWLYSERWLFPSFFIFLLSYLIASCDVQLKYYKKIIRKKSGVCRFIWEKIPSYIKSVISIYTESFFFRRRKT